MFNLGASQPSGCLEGFPPSNSSPCCIYTLNTVVLQQVPEMFSINMRTLSTLAPTTQFPAPLAASQKGLFLVQPRSSVYLMVCPVSAWENHLRSLCSFQEGCGGGIGHRKDWKDRWVCFGAVRWCVKYRTSQFWCEAYFWPRECCIKHSWRISVLKIQQCIAM